MSQLVHMRQRLKAIETIKKITGAMRLISRSFHTRLNKKKEGHQSYKNALKNLLEQLHPLCKEWRPSFFFPSLKTLEKKLYIIIGAQKGLCGSYNTHLIYWLNNNKDLLQNTTTDCVAVGNRTNDLLKKHGFTPVKTIGELKAHSLLEKTQELITFIKETQPFYTQVTIMSNYAQTFFVHKLKETTLIPLKTEHNKSLDTDDYLWLNKPDMVLERIAHMYLQTEIYNTLFEALLGEQAARFIAMDNATRNANKFLDSMNLQYNKLRQAKITKELTELAANFQN